MNTRISHCGRSCLFDPLKCFGVIGCFDESCKHELERWERLFYDAIGVYGSYWVFPYVEAGYLRDEWSRRINAMPSENVFRCIAFKGNILLNEWIDSGTNDVCSIFGVGNYRGAVIAA